VEAALQELDEREGGDSSDALPQSGTSCTAEEESRDEIGDNAITTANGSEAAQEAIMTANGSEAAQEDTHRVTMERSDATTEERESNCNSEAPVDPVETSPQPNGDGGVAGTEAGELHASAVEDQDTAQKDPVSDGLCDQVASGSELLRPTDAEQPASAN